MHAERKSSIQYSALISNTEIKSIADKIDPPEKFFSMPGDETKRACVKRSSG
jgi:hypothetical protein